MATYHRCNRCGNSKVGDFISRCYTCGKVCCSVCENEETFLFKSTEYSCPSCGGGLKILGQIEDQEEEESEDQLREWIDTAQAPLKDEMRRMEEEYERTKQENTQRIKELEDALRSSNAEVGRLRNAGLNTQTMVAKELVKSQTLLDASGKPISSRALQSAQEAKGKPLLPTVAASNSGGASPRSSDPLPAPAKELNPSETTSSNTSSKESTSNTLASKTPLKMGDILTGKREPTPAELIIALFIAAICTTLALSIFTGHWQ